MLSNYWLGILQQICLNALLGISVYLPISTGQLSLGSGGFAAIGGFTSAILVISAGWPLWLAIGAGALAAAVVAVVVGYPALRLRGVYLAVATLGFGEVVRVVALNLDVTGGALGLKNIPNLSVLAQKWARATWNEAPLGMTFSQAGNVLVLLGLLVLLALVLTGVLLLHHSRYGRACAAIKADEVAAEAAGIRPAYFKLLAFVLGAALAGLAGAFITHLNYALSSGDYGFSRAVEMLLYVILGGMHAPAGPVVGAAVVQALLEGLRNLTLNGQRLDDWRLVAYGALMLIMIGLRPQGLVAPRRKRPAPVHRGKAT